MINFNVPPYVGTELNYVREAVEDNRKICGDGPFTKKCQSWLEKSFGADKVLLTTSGTTALEMAAMLCNLEPGDEVILPSFTFSSTATAFVLMGAKLVFVDILPDTKNIDPAAIEAAITASVDYANANPRASADFIREHAQELAESVTSAHIRTFVTEYSRDLGDTGRQAIARLVETAARMQGLRLPEAGLFL